MNIAAKILTFIITTIVVGTVSLFWFGFMLVAMNGFSGSDAEYGITVYMIWAVVGSLLSGGLGVIGVHLLEKKTKLHIAAASLISILVFSVVGSVINFGGVFVGILIADTVRTRF